MRADLFPAPLCSLRSVLLYIRSIVRQGSLTILSNGSALASLYQRFDQSNDSSIGDENISRINHFPCELVFHIFQFLHTKIAVSIQLCKKNITYFINILQLVYIQITINFIHDNVVPNYVGTTFLAFKKKYIIAIKFQSCLGR